MAAPMEPEGTASAVPGQKVAPAQQPGVGTSGERNVQCPTCGKVVSVSVGMASGQLMKCPLCQGMFTAPAAGSAPPPAAVAVTQPPRPVTQLGPALPAFMTPQQAAAQTSPPPSPILGAAFTQPQRPAGMAAIAAPRSPILGAAFTQPQRPSGMAALAPMPPQGGGANNLQKAIAAAQKAARRGWLKPALRQVAAAARKQASANAQAAARHARDQQKRWQANADVFGAKSKKIAAADAEKEAGYDRRMEENKKQKGIGDRIIDAGDKFSELVIKSGTHLQGVFRSISGMAASVGMDKASPNTMATMSARFDLFMANFGKAFIPLAEGWSRFMDDQVRNGNAQRLGQAASYALPAAGAFAGGRAGFAAGSLAGPWGMAAGTIAGAVGGWWAGGGFGSGQESPEEARRRGRSNRGLPGGTTVTNGESAYDQVLMASMNLGANSPEARLLHEQLESLNKIFGILEAIRVMGMDISPGVR